MPYQAAAPATSDAAEQDQAARELLDRDRGGEHDRAAPATSAPTRGDAAPLIASSSRGQLSRTRAARRAGCAGRGRRASRRRALRRGRADFDARARRRDGRLSRAADHSRLSFACGRLLARRGRPDRAPRGRARPRLDRGDLGCRQPRREAARPPAAPRSRGSEVPLARHVPMPRPPRSRPATRLPRSRSRPASGIVLPAAAVPLRALAARSPTRVCTPACTTPATSCRRADRQRAGAAHDAGGHPGGEGSGVAPWTDRRARRARRHRPIRVILAR